MNIGFLFLIGNYFINKKDQLIAHDIMIR